ncbi:MAG TPA: NAD(P)-dependent oxidoreductase [Gaiellaceae bacterium]|nr:NAD(P)-dependent oxidoreductase [Gaiellaceae bacterium]
MDGRPNLGFVGLGTMGSRVAGRLLSAGHTVYGFNRTASKAGPLVERGLILCETPRAVAEAADIVFSMVTDGRALNEVAARADGILAGLGPGKTYIDLSTVSPQASTQLAERVRSTGAWMLDAPVSGSVPAVEAGTLMIVVGGDRDVFESVLPVLQELGQNVRHVGPNGHGLLLKLAINISLGVQMLAFSEGVLLAEKAGIARSLAVEVITGSAIGSPMLQSRGPLVVDAPDDAWFDVELMHKDLMLALATGAELETPLPSTAITNELFNAARAMGYAQSDIASVFDVLSEMAGTP